MKDTGRGITPEDRKNLYTDLPAEAPACAYPHADRSAAGGRRAACLAGKAEARIRLNIMWTQPAMAFPRSR